MTQQYLAQILPLFHESIITLTLPDTVHIQALGQAGKDLYQALEYLRATPPPAPLPPREIPLDSFAGADSKYILDRLNEQKAQAQKTYQDALQVYQAKETSRLNAARAKLTAAYMVIYNTYYLLADPKSKAQLRYQAPHLGAVGVHILAKLDAEEDKQQEVARVLGPIICAYLDYEPSMFYGGFAKLNTTTRVNVPVEYTSDLKYLAYLPNLQHLEIQAIDFDMSYVGQMPSLKTLVANNYNPSLPEYTLNETTGRYFKELHYKQAWRKSPFPEFNFLAPLAQCKTLTSLHLDSYQWSLTGIGRLPLIELSLNAYMDNDGGQFTSLAIHHIVVGGIPPPNLEMEYKRHLVRMSLDITKRTPQSILLDQQLGELASLNKLQCLSLNGYRGPLVDLSRLPLRCVYLNSHYGHLDPTLFPSGLPVMSSDLTK